MAKILIMDDDPVIVSFLSSLLRDHGYAVITADDGTGALERVRREGPDLILTDLVMPFRDGYEVLAELKGDPELRAIPVIVLSMKEREKDIVRGFDLGADDYIVKPFGAHELLARIRRQLRGRQEARPAAGGSPATGGKAGSAA